MKKTASTRAESNEREDTMTKQEEILLAALEAIASDNWDDDEMLVKTSNPDGTPVYLHPSDIARRALDEWGEHSTGKC